MKELPKHVKSVYQNGYARMDEFDQDPRLEIVRNIIFSHPFRKNPKLLDLGCGDGTFIINVAKKLQSTNVYGIDIAQDAIKKAIRNKIHGVVMDIDEEHLPYKDNMFDLVVCGNLIELVLNADHLLQETRRVLNKNGTAIFTFPNIAAWGSRIALFAGYLPFFSRISTQYDLGKMTGRIKKGNSTGFIRLLTLQSFSDLARLHGLKVNITKGSIEQSLPSYIRSLDEFISKEPISKLGISY